MSSDDRNGPIHVGDAARRVLHRLREASKDLSGDSSGYNCQDCKDTGIARQADRRSGPCKCQRIVEVNKEKTFF